MKNTQRQSNLLYNRVAQQHHQYSNLTSSAEYFIGHTAYTSLYLGVEKWSLVVNKKLSGLAKIKRYSDVDMRNQFVWNEIDTMSLNFAISNPTIPSHRKIHAFSIVFLCVNFRARTAINLYG